MLYFSYYLCVWAVAICVLCVCNSLLLIEKQLILLMIFTCLLPILGKIICDCVMMIFTILLQVKMDKYLAHSVSEAASVAWTHYTTTERAEPLLARLHYQSDLNNLTKSDNLNEQDEVPVSQDTASPRTVAPGGGSVLRIFPPPGVSVLGQKLLPQDQSSPILRCR